ncbi:MAG: MFS transporter [Tahibacter sp.]
MTRTAWLAIGCGALIVTISMGLRQSFGLFLQPVGHEFAVGREFFGFAIAVQNLLFGLVQPFVGAAADRYGTRRVVLVGALVYAAGLAATALAAAPRDVMAALGLAVGLGLSGTTFVVVLGGVGRLVTPQQRSVAFGLVTAGGSFGQFAIVPLAQALIATFGWREAMFAMAGVSLLPIIAVLGIRSAPAAESAMPAERFGVLEALRQASTHRSYWWLNLGFFVCGFQLAFIGTHFPAYLVDRGIAPGVGAAALALVGLFNIAGSYIFGILGGRRSGPRLLAGLYLARAAVISIFLLTPLSATSALVFAGVLGFLWLGTVPLTSGAVASMFGIRHMSTLYGIVFLSHQVGSFLGAWAAGRVYDATGNYNAVWTASIVLGLFAGAISWITDDRAAAVPRLREAVA